MEKMSSHYKVSHAQFVLLTELWFTPDSCKMHIGCYKSGLSWHADICDIIYELITVHKLAPPAFIWDHVALLKLKKHCILLWWSVCKLYCQLIVVNM